MSVNHQEFEKAQKEIENLKKEVATLRLALETLVCLHGGPMDRAKTYYILKDGE